MPAKYTNNASATIAANISSSSTTIVLAAGFGAFFPSLSAGNYFYGTLYNSSNVVEIVKVTARSGDTLTVVRGQDGTTANAYSAGDGFALRVVAASLNNFVEIDSTQTITGSKTFSSASNRLGAFNLGTGEVYVYESSTNEFAVRTGAVGSYRYLTVSNTGNLTVGGGINAGADVDITGGTRARSGILVGVNEAQILEGGVNQLKIRTGASGAYKYFDFNTSGTLSISNGGLSTAGDIYASGNIGSSGNITASGTVTAASDVRLKSDVQTLGNALEIVKRLRGTAFVKDGRAEIGVIAQEVQAVLPQVVLEGSDGYLSVAYGNMVAVLIEAVKELAEKIESKE